MNGLVEMLRPLATAALSDDARHANAWAIFRQAQAIGVTLPLVHRTAKPGDEAAIAEIFEERRIAAKPACTSRERRAGIQQAAYFFLGCGAYPEGMVGFVFDRAAVSGAPCSYFPLDSGSLDHHVVPRKTTAWDEKAKDLFFEGHLGRGDGLDGFAGAYLASHFREPEQYVRCPQRSQPDFATYHGLEDPKGDRRAFTIELQIHKDLPLDDHLLAIVVGKPSLLDEVPDDLLDRAKVAVAQDELQEAIAEDVLARLAAGAA